MVAALNARHAALHPETPAAETAGVAAFVPMDGYHLTRAQLDLMDDSAQAHARRGAEFTFDGGKFLQLVEALRAPLQPSTSGGPEGPATGVIYAPSFDHAVKDPRENDIAIRPGHRVVVFEGNYVCLDKEPWRSAAALMDERWFVEVDEKIARKRLVDRHVRAGIAADEVEAGKRADENDLVNGKQVIDNKVPGIDEVIVSREDGEWRHE